MRYRRPTNILRVLLLSLSLFLGEKVWAQGMEVASDPANRLASTPTLLGLAVFSVSLVPVVASTLPTLDFSGRGAEVARAAAGLRKARLQLDAKEQDLARMATQDWLDLPQTSGVVGLTRGSRTGS